MHTVLLNTAGRSTVTNKHRPRDNRLTLSDECGVYSRITRGNSAQLIRNLHHPDNNVSISAKEARHYILNSFLFYI